MEDRDAASAWLLWYIIPTEEAIYNSLFKAVTVSSRFGTREALPIEATLEILKRYGVVPE